MAPHRMQVRVYYEDTDFSGVVYHAGYLRFLERGRTEFLRAGGVTHTELAAGAAPLAFAVAQIAVTFRKAARMDDLLEVETTCEAIGGASLTMLQRIGRGTELLTEATVKIALLSAGRPARFPGWLVERLGTPMPRLR